MTDLGFGGQGEHWETFAQVEQVEVLIRTTGTRDSRTKHMEHRYRECGF